MKYLKIVLSVVVILAVAFLVIKGCSRQTTPPFSWTPQELAELKRAHPGVPYGPRAGAAPVGMPVIIAQPRMAIVLDDWGNSMAPLKTAIEIGRPLTLSILPHLPAGRRIAEEAHAHGLGVMLHLPMQPVGKNQPLEPHTIMTTTSDAKIRSTADSALESIPYAEGVNNHQGSAATSDLRVMRTLLAHLKTKGVFFIDSEVIKTAKGAQVAKETGIPFVRRDVFIDNELKAASIHKQLLAAVKVAKTTGHVVVIGHDRKVTLETIRDTIPEIEKEGVRLVLVKELVE